MSLLPNEIILCCAMNTNSDIYDRYNTGLIEAQVPNNLVHPTEFLKYIAHITDLQ